MSKVMFIGDLHGNFYHINNMIKEHSPDIIIQCGDFGIWNENKFKNINVGNTLVYFIDGNHEDFDYIENEIVAKNKFEIAKNVFYQPRGSYITINNKNILFIGGAGSIDKKFRTPGYDWWPNETISINDVENLPEVNIDIVVSHTCPKEFKKDLTLNKSFKEFFGEFNDPCEFLLSEFVLKKYNPKSWYFGHFHIHQKGKYENCNWTCLNTENELGFYDIITL